MAEQNEAVIDVDLRISNPDCDRAKLEVAVDQALANAKSKVFDSISARGENSCSNHDRSIHDKTRCNVF